MIIKGNYIKYIFYMLIFMISSGCSFTQNKIEELEKNIPPNMALVPSGDFVMGSEGHDGNIGLEIGVDEIPSRKVFLDSFYMDKFEVTNKEFKAFVAAVNTRHPLPEYFVKKDKYPSGFSVDEAPVVDVDWFTAKEFCGWKGKRLPSEAEWEKAARGDNKTVWIWGDNFDLQRGNTLENGVGVPMKVGSFPKGISPYGMFDMYGNVWEWTDSWYDSYPGSKIKRSSFGEKYPVIRGGAYSVPFNPFARPASRYYYPPSRYIPGVNECPGDMDIGFRCVIGV